MNKFKVGQRVYDTWYGSGVVIRLKRRRVVIKLASQDSEWEYDQAHLRHFVRLA